MWYVFFYHCALKGGDTFKETGLHKYGLKEINTSVFGREHNGKAQIGRNAVRIHDITMLLNDFVQPFHYTSIKL
jgi:hypothetical protein